MSGGGVHMVTLASHDPGWATEFVALRDVWKAALGDLAVAIEHAGSTAVLGLPTKAILDVDVVTHLLEVSPEVVVSLATSRYEHIGQREVPDREVFNRQGSDIPRDGSGCPTGWAIICMFVRKAVGNYVVISPSATTCERTPKPPQTTPC